MKNIFKATESFLGFDDRMVSVGETLLIEGGMVEDSKGITITMVGSRNFNEYGKVIKVFEVGDEVIVDNVRGVPTMSKYLNQKAMVVSVLEDGKYFMLDFGNDVPNFEWDETMLKISKDKNEGGKETMEEKKLGIDINELIEKADEILSGEVDGMSKEGLEFMRELAEFNLFKKNLPTIKEKTNESCNKIKELSGMFEELVDMDVELFFSVGGFKFPLTSISVEANPREFVVKLK